MLWRIREKGESLIPYASDTAPHRFLKKYGTWFQDSTRTRLLFVLHSPPSHWAACSINFRTRHVQFGDSLGWGRPIAFFRGLPKWLSMHFGHEPFRITNDLPCAVQSNGFSCPMIAVNTVASQTVGDAQWTAECANLARMRAFVDLAECSLQFSKTKLSKVSLVSRWSSTMDIY